MLYVSQIVKSIEPLPACGCLVLILKKTLSYRPSLLSPSDMAGAAVMLSGRVADLPAACPFQKRKKEKWKAQSPKVAQSWQIVISGGVEHIYYLTKQTELSRNLVGFACGPCPVAYVFGLQLRYLPRWSCWWPTHEAPQAFHECTHIWNSAAYCPDSDSPTVTSIFQKVAARIATRYALSTASRQTRQPDHAPSSYQPYQNRVAFQNSPLKHPAERSMVVPLTRRSTATTLVHLVS